MRNFQPISPFPISSTRSSGKPRKKQIPYNIRLFPTIALIFLAAGLPLAGHGLVEEDIAEVTKRLGEEPGNAELLLRRATLHRAHEDYSASKADLLAIGSDSPSHLEALLKLARLERENGQLVDGAAALVRYFAHEGNAPEAFREKGRLHYEEGTLWLEGGHPEKARGSFQLALQHFDQLPANKQSQPGLQTLRGEILKALQP